MKILPQLVSCTLVLGTATLAHAEPKNVASVAPLYEQAPPGRAPAPPRAAPPPQRDLGPAPDGPASGNYRHGFYMRLALGGGYLSDSETVSDGSSATIHGGGGAFDSFFGGSIVPGLAIGGGLMFCNADKPTVQMDGDSIQSSGTLTYTSIAGFADWYPMPTRGLHIFGMGGYSVMGFNDADGNIVGPSPAGPGFGLGVGYEWSLGKHYALGAMARYVYASLSSSTDGVTAHESVSSPELMLTGTLY